MSKEREKDMSDQLKNVLIKRKAYIENLILKKKEAMTKAPVGSLRTSTINGHFRYYRFGNENKNGIYLPKKEIELAASLAQKDYD